MIQNNSSKWYNKIYNIYKMQKIKNLMKNILIQKVAQMMNVHYINQIKMYRKNQMIYVKRIIQQFNNMIKL